MRNIAQMNIVASIGTKCEASALCAASTYGAKIVKRIESNLFFTAIALLPVIFALNALRDFAHFPLLR